METIGLDIDMETNIEEGYGMLDYNPNIKIEKDTYIRFYQYYPEYIIIEGNMEKDTLMIDTMVSWNDLFETYTKHKESIDSFIGSTYENNNDISVYDILSLADTIQSYKGLE